MSKIKLLVEIDEEDYGDFCDWFESVPSSVDGLPCVKGKFNTALYDAKPYNDSRDLISREALKKQFEDRTLEDFNCYHFIEAIDNAPPVPERDYSQGWHDAITKALNECNKHPFDVSEFCPFCGAEMQTKENSNGQYSSAYH